MRKITILLTIFLLIFISSIASAHTTFLTNDQKAKTNDISEDDKRYPIYDYRWGYTYRATDEYKKDFKINSEKYRRAHKSSRTHEQPEPKQNYYYKWNSYKKEYEKKQCYDNPPKNKLFYIKCP